MARPSKSASNDTRILRDLLAASQALDQMVARLRDRSGWDIRRSSYGILDAGPITWRASNLLRDLKELKTEARSSVDERAIDAAIAAVFRLGFGHQR